MPNPGTPEPGKENESDSPLPNDLDTKPGAAGGGSHSLDAIRIATLVTAIASLLGSIANVGLFFLIFAQNNIQKSAADRVWSSEQIAIIYERENCSEPDVSKFLAEDFTNKQGQPCPHESSLRSRQEAVIAYAKIKEDGKGDGDALLSQADLSEMTLNGVNLAFFDLTGTYLIKTRLIKARLIGTNLSRAKMGEATLIGAELPNASLLGADLHWANLTEAKLRKAQLGKCGHPVKDFGSGEIYSSADLRNATLQHADLTEATLCNVNFSGADLTGATLTNADLSSADLSAAVGLSRVQIEAAKGNKETRLPKDLKHPAKWLKTSGSAQ